MKNEEMIVSDGFDPEIFYKKLFILKVRYSMRVGYFHKENMEH